jgi:hypothetical protein
MPLRIRYNQSQLIKIKISFYLNFNIVKIELSKS